MNKIMDLIERFSRSRKRTAIVFASSERTQLISELKAFNLEETVALPKFLALLEEEANK